MYSIAQPNLVLEVRTEKEPRRENEKIHKCKSLIKLDLIGLNFSLCTNQFMTTSSENQRANFRKRIYSQLSSLRVKGWMLKISGFRVQCSIIKSIYELRSQNILTDLLKNI